VKTFGWWCAQSDTNPSPPKADLQGILAKNCLFCESGPDFGAEDQRLSGKFPTFVNRDFFEIRRAVTANFFERSGQFLNPNLGLKGVPPEVLGTDFILRLTRYMRRRASREMQGEARPAVT
jgi:hypothetical protein